MKFLATALVMIFSINSINGQVNEDFSDGELNMGPAWLGNVSDFIVDGERLRLNANSAGSSFLVTANNLLDDAIWQVDIEMAFNPSSSNFSKVYLISDQQDLSADLNGYFVKLGGSDDDISLYRQDGATEVLLIDGSDDRVDLSRVVTTIRVSRNSSGNWELFTILDGNEFKEGQVLDNTYTATNFFGVFCQYTSTRADKFHFDNISVDQFNLKITSVLALGPNQLAVAFNADLDPATAGNSENFVVEGLGAPLTSSIAANMENQVELLFEVPFGNGKSYNLLVENVLDQQGHEVSSPPITFLFFLPRPASFRDILINEIMADPSPSEDLPEAEFVEIYNPSSVPFQLKDWIFTDGTKEALIGDYLLMPDSFLLVGATQSQALFNSFGQAQYLADFPSLNNGGDQLKLLDADRQIVDSVSFDIGWYQDKEKDNGGWSLELINPQRPCSRSSNWGASVDLSGGTPGRQNSINNDRADTSAPQLTIISVESPLLITLEFDEEVESLSVTTDPIITTAIQGIPSQTLNLHFADSLQSGVPYALRFSNLADCLNNTSQDFTEMVNVDYIPPFIDEAFFIHDQELEIHFDEPLHGPSAMVGSNFVIDGIGPAKLALWNESLPAIITLDFQIDFVDDTEYSLGYVDLEDSLGNKSNTNFSFTYRAPPRPGFNDIIITEIMASPLEDGKLPDAEYIEIFNRSQEQLSLKHVKLEDASSTTTLERYVLEPQSYLILTKTSATALFDNVEVMGVKNWPSLNKSEDVISIFTPNGQLINTVAYKQSWYGIENAEGQSLELIDPNHLCGQSRNWATSQSEAGGTPGFQNSILDSNPNLIGPQLRSVFASDSIAIEVRFDEWLSPEIKNITGTISPSLPIDEIQLSEDPSLLRFSFEKLLEANTIYELQLTGVQDCNSNLTPTINSQFVLPEVADSGDLILNEIMFAPEPLSVEFVEIYNHSEKYINLKGWKLQRFSQEAEQITTENWVLAPAQYLVLTTDKGRIIASHRGVPDSTILEVPNMPTFPNSEGDISLIAANGLLMDSLFYQEDFHHPLIKDGVGVSLERLSFFEPTNKVANWQSAASNVGHATPGLPNSHLRLHVQQAGKISIEPLVFSPGNDGHLDFATIHYDLDLQGPVANITIYNAAGFAIRHLAENEIIANRGSFVWDGTDYRNRKVGIGPYIVLFEVFDKTGVVKTFKKKVIVGGRLR